MSQLTFAQIPGFFDLSDSSISGGQPLTDDSIAKISHNSKFGVVRCEIVFMGFYAHGNTVGTPVSPVDGYAYTRSEVMYLATLYSTDPPGAGFVPGQAAAPPVGAVGTNGQLYAIIWDINDQTGAVSLTTSYVVTGSAQTNTNNGILKVYAVCQRLSVNVAN